MKCCEYGPRAVDCLNFQGAKISLDGTTALRITALSIKTFNIITLGITTLSITVSTVSSAIMLSVVMLSVLRRLDKVAAATAYAIVAITVATVNNP